jgi:hypothetical protein
VLPTTTMVRATKISFVRSLIGTAARLAATQSYVDNEPEPASSNEGYRIALLKLEAGDVVPAESPTHVSSNGVVSDGKRLSRSVATIRPGSFKRLQRDGSGGGPYTDGESVRNVAGRM